MDEDSLYLFSKKDMFKSLIKQSYDLETNKSIVKHWSFNDEAKSRWIIDICLSAFDSSFMDDKPKFPLNIANVFKTIISEVEDDFVQMRIKLIFEKKTNQYNDNSFFAILLSNLKVSSIHNNRSTTIFQAIGVMTALLPDENQKGHDLATYYLYQIREDLSWILSFLEKNSNQPLFENISKRWNLLFEGKLHKSDVWKK
jgi:hypothetical protein